jgi:thiaminase/transcriptional activator TenA
MSLAATLWAEHSPSARVALGHRFVRGIASGTLDRPLFEGYILQDAFFLEAFARAYALALARCADRAGVRELYALLGGALDELHLHADYAERWGVADRLADLAPAPATLAYTDFLLATAALGSVGETCAAMTPCMRLYAYLGQCLAAEGASAGSNPYAEWVATYASDEFEALARKLEDLLDRYAAPSPAVRAAYSRAMALELAFFDAALAGR